MKVDSKKYWESKHEKYFTAPWIDKPTIFAEEIIGYLPDKGKILELGAGQGQDSRCFAKRGYEVYSTDFSKFALKVSKEKAEKQGFDIKFKELDISKSFPFKNNEFDIVYSHLALHYWDEEDTKMIFKEILRVLKPGGIMAAIFNSQSDPEIPKFEKVGKNLYLEPGGTVRSYWTADYLRKFVENDFEIILLDDKGSTYKDNIKNLVRFVGKKN